MGAWAARKECDKTSDCLHCTLCTLLEVNRNPSRMGTMSNWIKDAANAGAEEHCED